MKYDKVIGVVDWLEIYEFGCYIFGLSIVFLLFLRSVYVIFNFYEVFIVDEMSIKIIYYI